MTVSLREYHQQTSYQRQDMSGHVLDWQNQPSVYKTYPEIEPLPLPGDIAMPGMTLSSLLKGELPGEKIAQGIDITCLSRMLQLTYSLTARARYSGGEFYYRSVASAGALYPTEIYVATQGVSALEDALYHFSIANHGLFLLRRGRFPLKMFGTETWKREENAGLTFILSAIFFRSSWKYRDRSYRYHLLDTGHVIEHLFLACTSAGFPLKTSYDFCDGAANRFLGFDETKEVSLAIAHISQEGSSEEEDPQEIGELSEDYEEASRVSNKEIDYPLVRAFHKAGERISPPADSAPEMVHSLGVAPKTWERIDGSSGCAEQKNYAESVLLRRSKRNYVEEPLSQDCLAAILKSLCTPEMDAAGGFVPHSNTIAAGFLLGNTELLSSGFYLIDSSSSKIGLVKSGSFNAAMSRICLDQAWLANAALHFVFMTNTEELERRWGARGYRYAMMTAGRLGERLYLVATSLGLGCCGIGAFYDGDAAELLGLNSDSRMLYLVAVGPVKTRDK